MNLSILYFNDVHGYIQPHPELFYEGNNEIIKTAGGYSRIAGYIQQIRKTHQNVLVFDGGDTFHGTFPVVETKGEILLPVLNSLNIDAMVAHWDFAYGPQQLKKLASKLSYPVLAINIYNKDGSLFLAPYIFKQVGNIKMAIIGISSNIIDKTMPKEFSKGLHVTDGAAELPGFIDKVKSEGADLVLLLSHNGLPQDLDLLSKIPGVDVCLSAHTHNRLYESIVVNNTIVIQSGCHGSFIGHLDLSFNNNKITDHHYTLNTVDDQLPSNEAIDKLTHDALLAYTSLNTEIVGFTPTTLHRYNSLNSGMDNLLLSAIMHVTGCELAFSNGWRYGAPIAGGNIVKNDLFNIIPHNPLVSTTDLTGKEILEMLEENLERTFSPIPMHQMGGYVKRSMGLTAYIKLENPQNHRIQEIFIGTEHLQTHKTYKAAFVTQQGVPAKYGSNRQQTSIKAVDAMISYLHEKELTIETINRKAFIPI